MTAVETKAEFTEKMERLLDDAKTRFQELELDQMKKGEVEARAKLAQAQKRFEEKQSEMESQLKKARKAGDSAWDEIRDGLESAQEDLMAAVTRARDEFRGEVETSSS